MTDKTPAQAAKEFAAAHNIHLYAHGRRYRMFHNDTPLNLIAEVSGYPAALNAMRKWVDDEMTRQCQASDDAAFNNPNDTKMMHCDVVREDGAMGVFADAPVGVQTCAGGTLVLPEPSADPALNAIANNCFGTLDPITPDTVPMSREEMFAPVKAEYERLKELTIAQSNATYGKLATSDPAPWVHKTADEIKADIVAGVQMLTQQSRDYNDLEYGTGATLDAVAKRMGRDERPAGMSDREYRNLLIYGDVRGMPGVDFPMPMLKIETLLTTGNELDAKTYNELRDYCEADLEDYRKTQDRLFRKAQRRASGALAANSGPWHVMYNGQSVTHSGYASRADALDVVRWGFSHSDARIRNNWRAAAVTVEYRAS